jgi:predicted HicB family RNase H-like nuclease
VPVNVNVRIDDEVHRRAKTAAASLGKTLQEFVEDALRKLADETLGRPSKRR